MSAARLRLDACPHCNRQLDAASCFAERGARPQPGDVTLCLYCTAFLRFDEQLRHKLLTADELAALEPGVRAELERTRAAIAELDNIRQTSRKQ